MTIDELAKLREERLIEQLVGHLTSPATGIKVRTDQVDDVNLFRKAARKAARRAGLTVHTGISHEKNGDYVFAFDTSPSIPGAEHKYFI